MTTANIAEPPTVLSATTTTGRTAALAAGWREIRNIGISADRAYVRVGGSGVEAASTDHFLEVGESVVAPVGDIGTGAAGYVAAICPSSTATIQIVRVTP